MPKKLKDKIDTSLENIFHIIDSVGKRIFGSLWETVYLSVQDAISMAILMKIPSSLGTWITGKSFTGFDTCIKETSLSTNRYICFVMVMSDFALWAILAGRIIARFFQDLKKITQQGGGNKNAKQP